MQSGTWLFVLPWDLHHPGGVNQVVENLFDANLRVLGNRSLLCIHRWSAARWHTVEVDGRRTVYGRFRGPVSSVRPWRTLLAFALGLPAALWSARRLVKDEGVVRVNVHYPGLDALLWSMLRRFSPAPLRLVLSFHGADLTTAAVTTGPARRWWLLLLRSADEIVVCSDSLRADFERAFGAHPQLRVIGNGVDPAQIERKAAGTPDPVLPVKYIISLATFEEKKGIDVLLRAFALVAERDPDLHLLVAGRVTSSEYFERIDELRGQLRAAERVRFLPNTEHTAAMRLLRPAQALVLASRREPFGIVVLEAGALERPVIATSACGVAQRLTDGADLLVVPPGDAPAMAAAIQRILADNPLACRLAMSLRQRVHSEFTWERIVHQYAAIGVTGA